MTNISRALSISGFMTEPELEWLACQASHSSRIAEIGCWQGRSARALADNTPGTLFAIDHFRGAPEIQHLLQGRGPHWLIKTFLRNLMDCENVVVIRKGSKEAALLLSGFKFDLVFIDGSHDYATVKEDISWWFPLVSPDGIICGHDFRDAPHVEQAVLDSELPNLQVVDDTSIWWSRR